MSVELPQDAEGRDIPLDTKRLYPLEATEFGRVEIVDQIYFRPVGHDGGKLYRMDDLKRSLEPVRSI